MLLFAKIKFNLLHNLELSVSVFDRMNLNNLVFGIVFSKCPFRSALSAISCLSCCSLPILRLQRPEIEVLNKSRLPYKWLGIMFSTTSVVEKVIKEKLLYFALVQNFIVFFPRKSINKC